ncbi:MAG: 50S ribosomal protein L15e [archaeon]|jgi:large subunit ribosomal protein L15e
MGAWKYIKANFQKQWKGGSDDDYNYGAMMKKRTLEYRRDERAVVKLEGPTNIPAARAIGYKAKQGIFVARVRVRKGTGTHHRPKNKRRPKRQGQARLSRRKSVQGIAEERASKKFENAEVIGSYKIGEDGQKHYYEVVLADRNAPEIVSDKNFKWLLHGQQGRAERGKTFAGRSNKLTNLKNTKKRRRKKALDRRHG